MNIIDGILYLLASATLGVALLGLMVVAIILTFVRKADNQ